MAGFVSTKFSSQTMFGEVVTEIGQAPIRKSLIGSGANSVGSGLGSKSGL